MFQQTGAAVAILRRLKARRPQIVTLLGGANCEGEMADGVASLGAPVDHVFSGESEATFPAFLRGALAGRRPESQIVRGTPLFAMDEVPTPEFEDYYAQLDAFLSGRVAPERTWVMYETSRGCWWGQKQHCTFCGLNGQGMSFRRKSPARVLAELREIKGRHPVRNVMMTDNIMPFDYFKTLLPPLAEEGLDLNLFYEQKANLSLEKVMGLAAAGIHSIQPGIEALSTRLLKRMRKGVSAYQNLLLLRYGRAVGTYLSWNLLWGFPGDEPEAYAETLELLPLLSHLQPPGALGHLVLDRFSPHFFDAEAFGIENVRPLAAYGDVFPDGANLLRLAYHFVGDYESGGYASIETVRALRGAVAAWHEAWAAESRPDLRIGRWENAWALVDTRGLPDTEDVRLLDRDEAASLLVARPAEGSDDEDAAVAAKLAVRLDGWFVPLAVAEPQVLLTFEREARHGRASAAA
jgi:ribosomal peptide maturation radical SAM protein 1